MSEEPNDQHASSEKENEANKLWLEQLGISIGKKKFWSSDKFLSLLAFLISLGTFSTFGYQTYLIQKQQYANTMPYLMIQGYRDESGDYLFYSLNLENYGVGPAFVQDIKIHYRDSTYQGKNPSQLYFDYVRKSNLADSVNFGITNDGIGIGYVVPAGETIQMIAPASAYAASVINKLFQEREAVLEITYSSIYDEVWRVSSDNPVPEKLD